MAIARAQPGDLCPICKNGAVLTRVMLDTDEMQCTRNVPSGWIELTHGWEQIAEALENPAQTSLPLEEPLPQKKVIDEFPHTCPYCGAKAYLGITPGTTVHHKWASDSWSCDNSRKLRQGPAR